jgi:hypothetical protein
MKLAGARLLKLAYPWQYLPSNSQAHVPHEYAANVIPPANQLQEAVPYPHAIEHNDWFSFLLVLLWQCDLNALDPRFAEYPEIETLYRAGRAESFP